ncbi:hypothetical protein ASPWEDRAFT_33253 [Aspergillus wentii DTO 134E9]|uniref:Checkpoint protein RAD24-like helical bundle domain-containing protein n=1 Tax=Aspergillus wentii DTO 134E9 TaxID=1073089 RepID=A0A1L9R581_ASPWE|nr:uncharacterized protein ASPWEDRAFT_33253 [Aspergillus wentii DTO 134E9]KAI9927324.1 Cell cycle checkpoint protein rad17 [Aspergillus wentii]OJJ30052.1 hypothetical protein ASPWEDRAFT_33253 [Aspergillus wentii DTO 134E9]
MDTRAAKRQRRLTSEGEIEAQIDNTTDSKSLSEHASPTKNAKYATIGLSNRHSSSNVKALPFLSPRPKTIPSQGHASGQAHFPSHFSDKKGQDNTPANEQQRWSSQRFEVTRTAEPIAEILDDDDSIEDDYDSYDELFTQHFTEEDSIAQEDVKFQSDCQTRPSKPLSNPTNPIRKPTNSTKRFLLPSNLGVKTLNQLSPLSAPENDKRPWAQRYAPLDLEELAVHKKKVGDVSTWLSNVFTGRDWRRLLVLRGPAGSGKTTTLALLSKSLGFDIVEWKNPSTPEFGVSGYSSVGVQFDEFLGRGDKFGGLDLDEMADIAGFERGRNNSFSQRRVLLVEEFPAMSSRMSSSLSAFRLSLQRYLAATIDTVSKIGDPGGQASPPIIIIISETLLGSASSALDNFTAHRLLGPGIYNHPGTTIIDFNIIAPTFMNKALRLVLEKDASHSKRTRIPGPSMIENISEIGDIRSAISSLEFLCLKGDKTGSWGGGFISKAKKPSRNNVALTSMERESLKMITQRETSLGIFHAIGKIVYNKREDRSLAMGGLALPSPPDYLRQHHRPKISRVSVDELVDETGTDIQTFISALHENYVPSCDGLSFTGSLNGCIEALSDSDILSVDRKGLHGSRAWLGVAANSFTRVEKLRQDDISYQVAARGLLFALPYPVKRRSTSISGSSREGDVHKMFFPASLRLGSQSEKTQGLVDLWANRLLDPFNGSNIGSNFNGDSIGSWRNTQFSQDITQQGDDCDVRTVVVTMLSRNDMLLYQLPYMARISKNESDITELGAITGFGETERLSNAMSDDIFDYCGVSPLESLTTSQETSQSRKLRRVAKSRGVCNAFGPRLPPSTGSQEDKLILSDDDIEDE